MLTFNFLICVELFTCFATFIKSKQFVKSVMDEYNLMNPMYPNTFNGLQLFDKRVSNLWYGYEITELDKKTEKAE